MKTAFTLSDSEAGKIVPGDFRRMEVAKNGRHGKNLAPAGKCFQSLRMAG
jgi:hypothetical protein